MNGDTGSPEFLAQILQSATEIMLLLREADAEANKMTARLDTINSRPPRNPIEAVQSADELAPGCDAYAEGLKSIVPHFAKNIDALTDAYSGYVQSLDLETEEGQGELRTMNERLKSMIASFKSTAGKAKTLRDGFHNTAEKNHSPRLTHSARNLVGMLDELTSVYEAMETFGLKTLFLTEDKKESSD
jgi:hypothetical protein